MDPTLRPYTGQMDPICASLLKSLEVSSGTNYIPLWQSLAGAVAGGLSAFAVAWYSIKVTHRRTAERESLKDAREARQVVDEEARARLLAKRKVLTSKLEDVVSHMEADVQHCAANCFELYSISAGSGNKAHTYLSTPDSVAAWELPRMHVLVTLYFPTLVDLVLEYVQRSDLAPEKRTPC
jgi:hypothetical protein